MKHLLHILLFAFFLYPAAAPAQERLVFMQPGASYKDTQILDLLKTESPKNPELLTFAKTDLNNDGPDEFIARENRNDCVHRKTACPHWLIAFKRAEPFVLARFDAGKVLIGQKKSYGIRSLIVYNDPVNDFKHVSYDWDPYEYRFKPVNMP